MTTHNDDVDWDRWPVADYLAENYREVHASDAAVMAHHAAFYRALPAGGIARAVEFGAGPNLYPLMLASAACRRIDAVEAGASNVAYLQDQICHRIDASWLPFHALCRRLDPRVPATPAGALAPVDIVHADARALPPGRYELGSMHFVAESVTEDFAEFADFCRAFVRAVAPGGYLVAAFMENMPTYRIGPASRWPGCPVGPATISEVFTPLTRDLHLTHIDPDPALPDHGDSGMVLLTGVAQAV
ncbi:class I SAM-dependent methyltransferase [Streptomyces sp. NPDC093516]|uniref:class I SAM-dependent methyltransferase n=1 Tax=Streptomyces sp. NPDC093516 TaxID=3155304 RepID=UPI003423F6C5